MAEEESGRDVLIRGHVELARGFSSVHEPVYDALKAYQETQTEVEMHQEVPLPDSVAADPPRRMTM